MDQSVLRISVDKKTNDLPFPRFGQPQRLGEYTVTRDRCVVLGREDAKYLYEAALADGGRVRFDLNKGFSTFEEKEGDERLDILLDWIASQAPRGGPLKKVLHEADFLCWRGLLTRIAATPFCPKDSWEFAAARVGDVIFLCERETEETRQRKLSMSQRDKMMTYWGFKFEQYMTVAEKDGLPKVDEIVTCREEFAVVVRSTLASTAGKPLKLVYSGEVDAINRDGDLVELKTQRNALEGFFWKQKSMKWWLQSFLLGVRDIIVGYRDDDGFVKKVGSVHTDDLCKRGEWSGNICMNLLSTVLTSVRDLLVRDGEACIVRYEQNRDEITIHSALLPDIDFFTYNFRVHFNLESVGPVQLDATRSNGRRGVPNQ
ncbi:RAI1 like protein [Ancylostoma caninum]|uniref:Decapping nuclease n=1 Tax=Ancylostoma caninum TaxID=29170 RepID=A0A368G508_ANCCA|nr:RAI1 like protein [Ancylostoma caninum]